MNKHLIVIGVVILLLAVGLSGCNEQNATQQENNKEGNNEVEEYSFIGRWIDNIGMKWRFEYSKIYWYSDELIIEWDYEIVKGWELNTGLMTMESIDFGDSTDIDYKFSDEDKITFYYHKTGETITLIRVE